LIELLVVITIIVTLASIAYPVYIGVQERARVTQDMSNLRQIGLATQMYLDDNDGVFFSSAGTADSWMIALHKKALSAWKIFQSPFDTRTPSEDDAAAPVSYGINGKSVINLQADKIVKPSAFILFAPAQSPAGKSGASAFLGTAGDAAPGVTVVQGGKTAKGGTHSGKTRINALFADLHTENMLWSVFKNDTTTASDPDADFRWDYAGK
jgi:prepilin-type processing-associated H-X9-DG protein